MILPPASIERVRELREQHATDLFTAKKLEKRERQLNLLNDLEVSADLRNDTAMQGLLVLVRSMLE